MKTIYCLFVMTVLSLASGCLLERTTQNEAIGKCRSFNLAVQILTENADNQAIKLIYTLDDVDALRIIAVAAQATAWPMEAGENVVFDNRMEALSFAAVKRLANIRSNRSRESLNYAKRAFELDGATSAFFKSIEVAESARINYDPAVKEIPHDKVPR